MFFISVGKRAKFRVVDMFNNFFCCSKNATVKRFNRKSRMFQQLPNLMPTTSSSSIGKRISQIGLSPPANTGFVVALLLAKIQLADRSVVFICVCLIALYRSHFNSDLHQTSHTGRHQSREELDLDPGLL